MIIYKNESIDTVIADLTEGKIGIMLCDTIYGIVGVAPEAESRIQEAKGRGESHPFLQLIHPSWFSQYSKIPLPPELAFYWPGPLTIVTEHRCGGTTAFRAPREPLLELVKQVGKPIYSTSANISGEPYKGEIDSMIEDFAGRVDFFIPSQREPSSQASTIISIVSKPFTLIRPGAVELPEEFFT